LTIAKKKNYENPSDGVGGRVGGSNEDPVLGPLPVRPL